MKASFSLFPKFYSSLDVKALAVLVKECGFDTVNAVVREGYWVEPASLSKDLPAFTEAMRREGIEVHFASTGYSAEELVSDDTPLRVMADAGVRDFRMGYFVEGGGDPRASLVSAREKLKNVAPLCEKAGVRAVYQLHHRMLVPSPSAVRPLVTELPPGAVGVMLDPGNQAFEGFEDWGRSCRLLGKHVCAVGVKDVRVFREQSGASEPGASGSGKGWQREWVPIYEGVTDWYELTRALKSIPFEGTFVFMPFYDRNEPDVMTRKLTEEVAYLRKVFAEVEAVS